LIAYTNFINVSLLTLTLITSLRTQGTWRHPLSSRNPSAECITGRSCQKTRGIWAAKLAILIRHTVGGKQQRSDPRLSLFNFRLTRGSGTGFSRPPAVPARAGQLQISFGSPGSPAMHIRWACTREIGGCQG